MWCLSCHFSWAVYCCCCSLEKAVIGGRSCCSQSRMSCVLLLLQLGEGSDQWAELLQSVTYELCIVVAKAWRRQWLVDGAAAVSHVLAVYCCCCSLEKAVIGGQSYCSQSRMSCVLLLLQLGEGSDRWAELLQSVTYELCIVLLQLGEGSDRWAELLQSVTYELCIVLLQLGEGSDWWAELLKSVTYEQCIVVAAAWRRQWLVGGATAVSHLWAVYCCCCSLEKAVIGGRSYGSQSRMSCVLLLLQLGEGSDWWVELRQSVTYELCIVVAAAWRRQWLVGGAAAVSHVWAVYCCCCSLEKAVIGGRSYGSQSPMSCVLLLLQLGEGSDRWAELLQSVTYELCIVVAAAWRKQRLVGGATAVSHLCAAWLSACKPSKRRSVRQCRGRQN